MAAVLPSRRHLLWHNPATNPNLCPRHFRSLGKWFRLDERGGGGGVIVSTIVIFGLDNIPHKGLVITGTTIVLTGTNSLFALSTYYPLSLFLLGLSDMSGGIFITLSFTLLQIMVDDEMRGRVIGLAMSDIMMLGLGFSRAYCRHYRTCGSALHASGHVAACALIPFCRSPDLLRAD